MKSLIKTLFEHKTLALLGFGREGRSTYNLLRSVLPVKTIAIIDENEEVRNDVLLKNDTNLLFQTGKGCMQFIDEYDIAIKSPGIPSNTLPTELKRVQIISQSDIFLQFYGHQTIGVTGTKGKSTTSSLIFHILKMAGYKTLLVGNIGVPPFDCIDEIVPDSIIVMELSSHQLQYVTHAPHISVLLNLFQEHLDHYYTYEEYQSAKFNISKYQTAADFFIYNSDNETLVRLLDKTQDTASMPIAFSLEKETTALRLRNHWIELQSGTEITRLFDTRDDMPLKGHHNLYNVMAAAASCYLSGVKPESISTGIKSFAGLEHRIEFVGKYGGIEWYNDSISTIPEATIEAVKTLKNVDTLILGGFDRGIEYGILYPFLITSRISNLIFVGEAGSRIMNEFRLSGVTKIKLFDATDYIQVVGIAKKVTEKGKICVLSPAAASYDMFKNFEERGNIFKKYVRESNAREK
jgi:UDP-N-acetylmuramoylalanine--D-glutamate ligase